MSDVGGAYLERVRSQLIGDGCTVGDEIVGGFPAVVGYRPSFQVLALSKLHLFTVVAVREYVTAGELDAFTQAVSAFAKERKGAMRGAQSGVAAIAVLITEGADDAAKALASKTFRQGMGGFAALVQPALVDLGEGQVHTFRGLRWWGMVFSSYLKKRSRLYLPDPV